jgi:hypothetical protein
MLCSDELSQNRHYVEGEEILVCPAQPEAIVARLRPLIVEPWIATHIGERGRRRTAELYGPEAQLIPRSRLLRRLAQEVGVSLQGLT